LATGKMQLCNAGDLGISQPSVSRAINQTINTHHSTVSFGQSATTGSKPTLWPLTACPQTTNHRTERF